MKKNGIPIYLGEVFKKCLAESTYRIVDDTLCLLHGAYHVENIIQAVARDLLAEALLRISKNPDCKIIAHVHDEIIIEADPAKVTLDDMIKAMCVLPEWGEGLILNAAGFTNDYYMKD